MPRVASHGFLKRRASSETKVTSTDQEGAGGKKRSWADAAIEELEVQQRVQEDYIITSFLSPTSSMVERLFSTAKLTYSDLRYNFTQEGLEQLLFMRMNSKFGKLI